MFISATTLLMQVPSRPSSRSQSSPRPFYLPPSKKVTPAAIVRECRDWLQTVATQRPFTPKASARRLLTSSSDVDSRPTTASTNVSSHWQTIGEETRTYVHQTGLSKGRLTPESGSSPLRRLPEQFRPPLLSPLKASDVMRVEGIPCRKLDKKKIVDTSPSLTEEQEIQKILDNLNHAMANVTSDGRPEGDGEGRLTESNCASVLKTLESLFGILEKRSFEICDKSLHNRIARVLLGLSRCRNPRLSLKVVDLGILMGPHVVGLAKICKIFYRVAKDAKNDELFLEITNFGDHVVLLLNALDFDPHTSSLAMSSAQRVTTLEGLLYCCGALKFLTASDVTQETFCTSDILHCLNTIHKSLELYSYKSREPSNEGQFKPLLGPIFNVLLQITEIFCVVSSIEGVNEMRNLMVESGVLQTIIKSLSRQSLCPWKAASSFPEFYQVKLNWARAVAHATEHVFVCRLICGETGGTYCQDFIKLILLYRDHLDFVIRLVYALGNMAALCETARKAIFFSTENIKKLCNLCRTYAASLTNEKPNSPTHEALVKLTRVMANASVGEEGGALAANSEEFLSLLLSLTKLASTEEFWSEELLHNSLIGLNNVTFHMKAATSSQLTALQHAIGRECLRILDHFPHNENTHLCVIRVLGNLTRYAAGRATVLTFRSNPDGIQLIDRLLALLDSSRDDIVYCVLGVLVNLMAESAFLTAFYSKNGISKLTELLQAYAGIDWQVAALLCKVICNFLVFGHAEDGENRDIDPSMIRESMTELGNLLPQLIDEKALEGMDGEHEGDHNLSAGECSQQGICEVIWREQFLPVALHLLSLLTNTA